MTGLDTVCASVRFLDRGCDCVSPLRVCLLPFAELCVYALIVRFVAASMCVCARARVGDIVDVGCV